MSVNVDCGHFGGEGEQPIVFEKNFYEILTFFLNSRNQKCFPNVSWSPFKSSYRNFGEAKDTHHPSQNVSLISFFLRMTEITWSS